MKKIGIFYGSATGTTEKVARRIAALLSVPDEGIHDVGATAPSAIAPYDILVMGSSTWGSGEMETDWYDFTDALEVLDLKGKKAALFGCGDQTMEDTFCSGVGELYDRLRPTGIEFIAPYDTIGYSFEHSKAVPENAVDAVGLLLDEVNLPELTETRLRGWTALVADAAR